MLHCNFEIAHIAVSVNTAVDFLFRLVTKKTRLKIREDVQTTAIGVTRSSLDVDDKKEFFFTQADNENESEKQ